MALKNWFMEIKDNRSEQRRHERIKALNLIRISKSRDPRDGLVLNINDVSECGVGFRTKIKMEKGQAYVVLLHTPDKDIEGQIIVRWVQWIGGAEKAYEVGCEFDQLASEDGAYLKEWLSKK